MGRRELPLGGRVSHFIKVLAIFPFTGKAIASLLQYRYGAKSTSAANVSNFKMAVVIILKNYYFRIII